jgi:hypothetical protein
MSWSIHVTASKPLAKARVEAAKSTYDLEQFQRAKALILLEIDAIADTDGVKVEANGSQSVASATNPAWSQVSIKVEPVRIEGLAPVEAAVSV